MHRKLSKSEGTFPNEESLLKLLYIGIDNAQKKWSKAIRNRNPLLSQLAICHEGSLDSYPEL